MYAQYGRQRGRVRQTKKSEVEFQFDLTNGPMFVLGLEIKLFSLAAVEVHFLWIDLGPVKSLACWARDTY